MIRKIFFITIASFTALHSLAQEKVKDTVIVKLAKTSQVIFTIQDRNDLEILKQYDFQNLFQDIIIKIENEDTTALVSQSEGTPMTEDENLSLTPTEESNEEEVDWSDEPRKYHWRTTQSFNFDLGTNNYLSNGKFPDSENAPYAVRPWGSWYIALNSIQRTRLGKNFFLEWGGGVSWYNFKFQEDNARMTKDDTGVSFFLDETPGFSYKKSKLTVSYVNAYLVPLLDFGGRDYKRRIWDGHHSSFRIGAGPYIGYRIDSYSKIKYKEDGDSKKDRDHDAYYLENIRYGIRTQIGFRSTDIFFNYDMNDLFTEGKGPTLNAFSFGVIF